MTEASRKQPQKKTWTASSTAASRQTAHLRSSAKAEQVIEEDVGELGSDVETGQLAAELVHQPGVIEVTGEITRLNVRLPDARNPDQ